MGGGKNDVNSQGAIKLVSVVSRILDTMRLVRHYGLKTTQKLRHNWLDNVHLITIFTQPVLQGRRAVSTGSNSVLTEDA